MTVIFQILDFVALPEIDVASVTPSPFLDNLNQDQINVLENEKAGQLYVYRYSNTTVVLGTRNVSLLGANIGIKSNASGRYQCRAENVNNGTKEVDLNVVVSSK